MVSTASNSLAQPQYSDEPDLTEQIRISVQNTHIGQHSFANETGGNISEVLDNFDEPVNMPSYNHGYIEDNSQVVILGNNASESSSSAEQNQSPTTTFSPSSVAHNLFVANTSNNDADNFSSSPSRRIVRINEDEQHNNQYMQETTPIKLPPTTTLTSSNQQLQANQIILDDAQTAINKTSSLRRLKSKNNDNKSDKPSHEQPTSAKSENDILSIIIKQQDDGKSSPSSTYGNVEETLSMLTTIPPFTRNRQAGYIKNTLFNGASFSGFQKSMGGSYEVNVRIQHIDYANLDLCGYLCISHLTESHPSLTTFFKGEIISRQYPFLTRKWDATEDIDREHWSKFEDFDKNYNKTFNDDDFDYEALKNSNFIYMRWKEHFLVPDHTIKQVDGASYAGFYYICYSRKTSSIKGLYFHIDKEHYER